MVNGVDSNTYVKILEEDLFNMSQYIYVYSTKGEVIVLANGSSALDFAFKVDSKGALKTSKILINGLESSFDTPLKNGAIINVKYSRGYTVNNDWLELVNSNYAKVKINEYLEGKED
jgi:(p)ppGpp synthase/HD superfamily hydrolase